MERNDIKEAFKAYIQKIANDYASQYERKHQRVAFESFLAGMEAMSAIMAGRESNENLS